MHLSHVCLSASRLSTFTMKTCSPQQSSLTRNRRPLATVSGLLFISSHFAPLFIDFFLFSPHLHAAYLRTFSPFTTPRQRFFALHLSLPTYFAWTSESPVRTYLRRQDANSATLLSTLPFSSLASSLVPVNSQASSKCVPARNPSRPGVFFLSKKKRMLPVRQDR